MVKRFIYHYYDVCPEDPEDPPPNTPSKPRNPPPDLDGPSPYEWCEYLDTVETHYVRGLGGKVLAEYELDEEGNYDLKRKYIYAGDQRIAMVDENGDLYYYLNDHLGSARLVFRDQVTPTTDRVADKYGKYWAFGEDAGFSVQTNQPFRYTGKPFDNEGGLGLYYYGARYYDPKTGRFYSVDPARGRYPGWSPFVYALNNPLKYRDPDGRVVVTASAGTVGAVLVLGAATIAFIQYQTNPEVRRAYDSAADAAVDAGGEMVDNIVEFAGRVKDKVRGRRSPPPQDDKAKPDKGAPQVKGPQNLAKRKPPQINVPEQLPPAKPPGSPFAIPPAAVTMMLNPSDGEENAATTSPEVPAPLQENDEEEKLEGD